MKKLLSVIMAAVMTLSLCTMTAFAAETTTAKTTSKPKTYAATKSSVVGKWYSLGRISDTEAIFYYNKDGTFSISAGQDSMSGRYSVVKNGLIKMTVKKPDIEPEDATIYIPAVMDNGMLLLSQDEIEYKDFKAYKSGQKLNEYFDDVPYFFTKKKPVKANQEDILGAWSVKLWEDDEFEEEGIFVFNKSSTTLIDEYNTLTEAIVFKNGSPVQKGNISDGYEFTGNDEFLYMCGDKLYVGDDDYMIILERCKKVTLTDKILEKAYDEDEYYYFKDGKICFNVPNEKPIKYTISGDYLIFTSEGTKYKLKAYITDKHVFLSSKEGNLFLLREKPAKGQ